MAGNSSSAKNISRRNELVGSCSPVTEQMDMLRAKAIQLAAEKTILGNSMVQQIKNLIMVANLGAPQILNAERVEINASPELEGWLEKVYDAISEAEYLLDECEYHRHHHRATQPIPRLGDDDTKESKSKPRKCISLMSSAISRSITSNIVWPATSYLEWSDTVKKFKSTNSKLKKLLGKGNDLILATRAEDRGKDQRSAALQAKKDVVDIESKVVLAMEKNELGKIVDKLLYSGNDKDLSFFGILGWSETGKKVLAQQLYKNEEVKFHYDERMWVQVSSYFDHTVVAKSMLTSLTRTKVEVPETNLATNSSHGDGKVYHVDLSSTRRVQVSAEEVIDRRLKERLKGRRYLLVLDGLSEVQAPDLKKFLEGLGGAKGCKVLTTGADPEPKSTVSSVEYYYKHKMVLESDDYRKMLFQKICFPVTKVFDECPADAYYVRVLGSLMCRMKDDSQWRRIDAASKTWKDPNHDILKLCFDYMSSIPLKRCLQCCCLFPKGCLISREELIQLWMAHGYLNITQSVNDSELVDLIGLEYYDILLKCGFLQVSEEGDFERQTCKVPHLLWDVIKFPGLRTAEKNQNLVDFKGAVHLLINCQVKVPKSGWISREQCLWNLHTLRLENCGADLEGFLRCAPCLRVLIFVDESVEELPLSIGKLKHLKYLDISKTKIQRLPDTISQLYNLQTLRLYGLVDIPMNFKNLACLKHISIRNDHLSTAKVFTNSKLDGSIKVWHDKSSLKVFLDKDGYIDSWEWLKVPRTCLSITIHCLENATTDTVREQTAGFVKKHGIEGLKLNWSATRENSYDEDHVLENLVPNGKLKSLAIENFKGTSFPPWMMKIGPSFLLHNLVKMELENCSWCEKLPPLGDLHSLVVLKIVRLDSVLQISHNFYGTDAASSFPKLKVFILCQMKNLKVWHGSDAHTKPFPVLTSLEVEECPELTSIPNMVGIRKLRIAHTEKLTTLAGNMEHLSELELFGFPVLQDFPIGTARSLKSLKIGCFKASLSDLSSQLEHLTGLTNLTIWGYNRLVTLPDWLVGLHSLQLLKLQFCERLMHIPSAEKMQLLASLTELNISNCPILEERFIRGSRPEWKKVHPDTSIIVNGDKIHPPQIEIESEYAAGHEAGHALVGTAVANRPGQPQVEDCEKVDLFFRDHDGSKIQVASGFILNGTHQGPHKGNLLRVRVCEPMQHPNAALPHPNPKFKTISAALGSIVKWPRDLVGWGTDDKEEEAKPDHSKSKLLPADYKLDGKIMEVAKDRKLKNQGPRKLAPSVPPQEIREITNKWLPKAGPEKEFADKVLGLLKESNFESTSHWMDFSEEVFCHLPEAWIDTANLVKFAEHIGHPDNMEWIDNVDMDVWSSILFDRIQGKKAPSLQFISAAFTSYSAQAIHSQNERIENVFKVIRDRPARFYILPYHRLDHWILVLIAPDDDKFYVLDSLYHGITSELPTCYNFLIGVSRKYHKMRNGDIEPPPSYKWDIKNITPKHQRSNWECGYYVMMWMEYFATDFQDGGDIENFFPKDLTAFPRGEIDAIVTKWCEGWVRKFAAPLQTQATVQNNFHNPVV